MASLISSIEQQQIKPLSPNWIKASKELNGTSKFDQLAEEVEGTVLSEMLGFALLQDVQKNPAEARNIILLEGGSFENCDGNNIDFKGLKYILAYSIYKDYIIESQFADTYSGMVTKNRSEATDMRDGVKTGEQNRTKKRIMQEYELLKDFLNENYETYPLWNCTLKDKKIFSPRIISLRNTIR